MVRGLRFPLLGVLMLMLASCATPTPLPTPRPTFTPIPPSATPIIMTLNPASLQAPATWTPIPTGSPAATSTRRPTSTQAPSATLTATPGPFKGQLGVLSADNVITIAIARAELEQALADERANALYSSIISSSPKVTFANKAIQLEVILNNYTTEGLRSEVDFALRVAGRQLRADITGSHTARGTLLTSTQISAVRDLLNTVLTNALITSLSNATVPFENPQVQALYVEESRLVITARIKPLPTPTEGASPTPSITPTDAPTEITPTATATEGTPPASETAATNTAPPPTLLPTGQPTLFPTVTP